MKLPKINASALKVTAKTTFNTAKILTKKYAPVVFVTAGVVGYGFAMYKGIQSGKKLEQTKAKYEEFDEMGVEYSKRDVVVDVAKDIAVPVAIATASTALIGVGFAIQTNRLKAVSAALAMATEEHARYRLRAKEVLDEETFKRVDSPLETKKVEVDGKEIDVDTIVPNEGDFYGRWFKYSRNYASDSPEYNEAWVQEVDRKLTEKISTQTGGGMLTFAEVLDELGFEVPRAALPFGWTDTDGFFLEWDTHEVWNEEEQIHEPQLYVRWQTPRNLYATTNLRDLVPGRKELN